MRPETGTAQVVPVLTRICAKEAAKAMMGIPMMSVRPQTVLYTVPEKEKNVKPEEDLSDSGRCNTCDNRKYKDGSNDPGVSFKTPTRISPESSASMVRAHEGEHVSRNRAEASREGRKVVSQSVTYSSALCPECGKSYVSGGTTRTTTKADTQDNVVPYLSEEEQKGTYLDMYA